MKRRFLNRATGFLLILSLTACGRKESTEGKSKADAVAETATPVRIAAVSRQTLPIFVSGPGKTSALVQQKVRAPFSGTLISLSVADGDAVQRGQTLGVIVARDSDAALSGAREMLREATTPAERHDAERAVALAEKNLVRKPLAAACDGAILSHAATSGDRVSEDQEILTINDASSIVFVADVPQGDLPSVHPGESATIQIAGVSQPVAGIVHAVLPGANSADYTGSVRIDFTPAGRRLALGILGTARILVSEHRDATVVPDGAVLRDDVSGSARIGLVQNNRAHWVDVQTGLREGGRTEILAPALTPDQSVIISGLVGLPEGKLVSAQP